MGEIYVKIKTKQMLQPCNQSDPLGNQNWIQPPLLIARDITTTQAVRVMVFNATFNNMSVISWWLSTTQLIFTFCNTN